jgi:hypothetical protein
MKVKWYDTDFWQVALYVIGILLVAFFFVGMQDKIRPDGKSYMSGRSKTRYAAYF